MQIFPILAVFEQNSEEEWKAECPFCTNILKDKTSARTEIE